MHPEQHQVIGERCDAVDRILLAASHTVIGEARELSEQHIFGCRPKALTDCLSCVRLSPEPSGNGRLAHAFTSDLNRKTHAAGGSIG